MILQPFAHTKQKKDTYHQRISKSAIAFGIDFQKFPNLTKQVNRNSW